MEPTTSLERLIIEHPERPWNWDALPANPGVRPGFVLSHEELPWGYLPPALYENPCLTPKWFLENPDVPMDWNLYSKNPSLTLVFLRENLGEPWNWTRLSMNPVIPPEFVEDTMEDPRAHWEWGSPGLSSNPSMTYSFVAEHMDMPWDYWSLSQMSCRSEQTKEDAEKKSRMRVQRRTARLRKALMRKTWHPSRYQEWCLTEDEKEELCGE